MAQQLQAACERILFGFTYDERPDHPIVDDGWHFGDVDTPELRVVPSTFPCLCGKRFMSLRGLKGHVSASKPKGAHAELPEGGIDD